MSTYTPLVYMEQGGDKLTMESGGEINVKSGGKITAAGTQASHIADLATDATNAALATGLNAVLAALEGVGVLATS